MNIKHFTFLSSLLLYFITSILWILFDPYQITFQFLFSVNILEWSFDFGIDGISLVFLFLTTFFMPFCFLFSWNTKSININMYYIAMLAMELLLICIFITLDLVIFYIFFEAILIPIFIMIGLQGLRSRRIHAAYLLFFYTLVGSMFMLVAIISIYLHTGSTNIQVLWFSEFSTIRSNLLWLAFFFAFATKVPIYPFHIWLPEAHVEAPTEGSVILAGILLKLGTYGFLRILLPSFIESTIYFIPLVYLLASIAVIYTSLTTLRQIDIKRVIAYSSVSHMNLCILGLFSMNLLGVSGSILVMLGHGIVSAGLFFLIGMLYNRYKTKIIFYYSGIVQLMPLYSTALFLLTLGNISMPLTVNFTSEFLILCGLLEHSIYLLIFASIGIFLGTAYSMWLYNRLVFGTLKTTYIKYYKDINRIETYLIIPFILAMLLFGIYPKFLMDMFIPGVLNIII
jgi:proton-translocating NADH-quinone oxidoreductase chain M